MVQGNSIGCDYTGVGSSVLLNPVLIASPQAFAFHA